MNDEGRHYLSVPKVLGTIGLAMVFALAMMAVVNFFWSSPCGGRVFGQAAECPVGSAPVFTNDIQIQSGSAFGVTITAPGQSTTTTWTIPTTTDISVGLTLTQTLTNKTLTGPTVTGAPTAAAATWTDLGTTTTINIDGGTIDGVTWTGGTIQGSPSAGTGLTLPAVTLGGTVTSNGQTFSGTIADLGTVTTVDIDGGTIDGVTWTGGTIQGSPSAGTGLTLPAVTLGGTVTSNGQTFSGTIADLGTVTTVDIDGGTIDGVTWTGLTIDGVTWTGGTIQGSPSAGTGLTLPAVTLGGTVTSNGQTFSGTIADLGTVTTVDINAGTVDGATIGGASAAAGTFTTVSVSDGNITNAGDIALDSLSSDAGSTITVTPTTDTIFSNGTGVVIGHTSQLTTGTRTSELQVIGTDGDDTTMSMSSFRGADANGPRIVMMKSRETTPGSFTIVADNDRLGDLEWAADDGTDYNTRAAAIFARINGTPGANDMPTELVFAVTADGANSTSDRWCMVADGGMTECTLASQGAGTINAQAVYDNGALLTDYVSDAYKGLLTAERLDHYDDIVPDKQVKDNKGKQIGVEKRDHDPAREFAERGTWVFDPIQLGDYFLDNGHLPNIFGEAAFVAGERASIGERAQELLEMIEVLVLQNYDLAKRVDALEAAQ